MNKKNDFPLLMTIFSNNSCYNYETDYLDDEGENGVGTFGYIPLSKGA
jgi:hypothetical protein